MTDNLPPFGFEDTSFQAAGKVEGIQKLVKAFYRYMDTLEEAQEIRAMHSDDLSLSEEKLWRFLSGWLGGEKLYREKFGPISIPQAHAHLKVNETQRDAWLLCMDKAIDDQPYSSAFSQYLKEQFRVPANRIVVAGSKNTVS